MRHFKFSRRFISVLLTLTLLVGCRGKVTKTPTALPPTPVVTVASATPDTKAKPGTPGIGDSLYPSLGNGGYDVQHYTLDLTVNDVATGDLAGKTTIDARATQNLSSFNLDFIGFEITNLTVNGQTAQYKRINQELTITPSTPLTEGESFTVDVQYHGSPEDARSGGLFISVG